MAISGMVAARNKSRTSDALELVTSIVLVAIAYFVVAKAGMQLAFVDGNVTPVFPAAGVAVAVLVLGGLRLWPGIFLGALSAHLTTDVGTGTALLMSAAGPLAAAAAAAFLRSPRVGFDMRFRTVRDATVFVAAGVLLPATISAVWGVTALFVGSGLPGDEYAVALASWWVGDAIGAMVAGSLVLVWSSRPLQGNRRVAELALLLVLPVALTMVLFLWSSEGEALLLPLLVAAAIRLQTRWTVVCVAAVSLIAAWATANGHGPFVEATENESLVQLSLFLAAATLTTLVLSAAVTERDEHEGQARHDDLTGLPNRLFLVEQLNAAIARRQPFTLLFIDIDGLKQVNDTYGHDRGDALLAAIGERIAGGLRRGDFAARLAGDEFTVVAFDAADEEAALAAGRRVAASLTAPFDIDGSTVTVTASVGAALCHGDGDAASVLREADAAMYRAKRAGGNSVLV